MADILEESTPELVCNCGDAFRLAECPVHPLEDSQGEEYGPPSEVLVTSAHRSDPTRKTGWVGFSFVCDNCNKCSIFEWFEFCPGCGSRVKFDFPLTKGNVR